MDIEILNAMFSKGYKYFQGFKEKDSLDYEFSTRYNLKGETLGITLDNDLYELRMYKRGFPSNKRFQTKGELLSFLNEVG